MVVVPSSERAALSVSSSRSTRCFATPRVYTTGRSVYQVLQCRILNLTSTIAGYSTRQISCRAACLPFVMQRFGSGGGRSSLVRADARSGRSPRTATSEARTSVRSRWGGESFDGGAQLWLTRVLPKHDPVREFDRPEVPPEHSMCTHEAEGACSTEQHDCRRPPRRRPHGARHARPTRSQSASPARAMRPAMRSAAAACMGRLTWLYVSSVTPTLACPSRS